MPLTASDLDPGNAQRGGRAIDEAGNIWETDAAGNAVRLVQQAGSQLEVATVPISPEQQRQIDRQANQDRQGRDAAERDRVRFDERNRPTLPAGYTFGPDGRTAIRIPGLPADKDAAQQQTPADLEAVRTEALDKIRLARSLQKRSRDGWFTTGIGSSAAGYFRGTPAYDLAQDTETLKNAGALTRVMEMSKQNGGKNPLTPLSNSDFQALSNSLTNLDPGQSDEQYQANVQRTIDLYERAYKGAGGTDLEGDLNPQRRRKQEPAAPVPGATTPPPSGPNRSAPVYGGGGPSGAATLATGGTKTEADPSRLGLNARVSRMLSSGVYDSTIRSFLSQSGADVSAASVDAALDFRRRNPGYKGGYAVDLESRQVPTTAWNRFAASPLGTGIYAAVDGGMAGLTDEMASMVGGGDLAELNARKQGAFAANPLSALAGQTAGTIGSMAGAGALSRTAGLAARLANPALAGDIAFGTASGMGQSNDNRLLGGTAGAVGGLVGNVAGNTLASGVGRLARTNAGMRAQNRVRGVFGAPMLEDARPLTGVDRTAFNAIDRAGTDNVTAALTEAQQLGVPMSLADTNPNLRELAGAAVRRSPTASAYAENALLPRSRGQYDRFTSAVARDLGPTTNVPQLSADLMSQARNAAAGLYDRAYSNPVPSTPEMDAILATPFGRDALGRARTIAANERRSPDELGFALAEDGSVRLNPRPNSAIADHLTARAELDAAQEAYRAARQSPTADAGRARDRVMAARESLRQAQRALEAAPDPGVAANVPAYTTQTLDYVKRGMDDVLEDQRNPITGRLVLDEAGRAQNQVRSQLLSEVDRLNPDFAAARAAYAGPMEARDALSRGADAYRLQPDELAMQVGAQSPDQLGQMQLGYRGAMVDHAGQIRDNGNPWEATLGSPAARQRLETLYPEEPGVGNLMRQREIEAQLAQTTNGVLGNSRTAQRQIADDAFAASNPLIEGSLHAGAALATGGASIPGTAARIAGSGLKNWMARGRNRMSEARAEALAPVLLDTDPRAALDQVSRYMAQQRAWQELIARTTPTGSLRVLGRAAGSQVAVTPLSR